MLLEHDYLLFLKPNSWSVRDVTGMNFTTQEIQDTAAQHPFDTEIIQLLNKSIKNEMKPLSLGSWTEEEEGPTLMNKQAKTRLPTRRRPRKCITM